MSLFDVISPVMIGPSSSHTAGAAKIGFLAKSVLGKPFQKHGLPYIIPLPKQDWDMGLIKQS